MQTNQIAEIQISYSHKVKPSQQVAVTASADAYNYLLQRWDSIDYRESFAVLLLSRANKVLGFSWISLGGVTGTIADVRVIYQTALKSNASGIILAHNHPSGQLMPSHADETLTRKLKDAGVLLDIQVIDHVILTSEGYYSFADEGRL